MIILCTTVTLNVWSAIAPGKTKMRLQLKWVYFDESFAYVYDIYSPCIDQPSVKSFNDFFVRQHRIFQFIRLYRKYTLSLNMEIIIVI